MNAPFRSRFAGWCAALATFAWAASPLPAAALEWEQRELTVRPAPLQTEVEVEFPFVNRGAGPVVVTDIRTNCDCLAASADRSRYDPGQRGVIRARFTTGDRLGLYERAIVVATDEGGEPVRLALKVDVPAAAEVTPRSVDWLLGAEPEPRTIELRVAPEITLDFASAAATGPDFDARLEPVEPGRCYRVHIVPRTTGRRASAAVRIRGMAPSGREVVVSAYAYVR